MERAFNINNSEKSLVDSYNQFGFVVAPNVISSAAIEKLLSNFCEFISIEGGGTCESAFDDELCNYLTVNRAFQSRIYDKFRETPHLLDFAFNCGIIEQVKKLDSREMFMLGKIILRIDQPLETSELAVWHQDFYYVEGNTDVITAWIPLQDVTYANGCLSVMPRTHLKGALPHTQSLLKKKKSPENIFTNEVRYVEMKKGDCLFFHSLLLHNGNLNLSERSRYSIQIRFSPASCELPPNMGKVYSI